MKKIKNKGFTLIELMVVIAIIGLLSSIVLASLKSAREKATLNKVVAEMKSLQNALELYRNANGTYPMYNIAYHASDAQNLTESYFSPSNPPELPYSSQNGVMAAGISFNTFQQTYLIANKFLSKAVNAPNYPNNCPNATYFANANITGCYALGYHTNATADPAVTYYCGRQKVNNYFIYFISGNKSLNLPKLEYYYSVANAYLNPADDSQMSPLATGPSTNIIYCLAM